jgi:hypothetical protein
LLNTLHDIATEVDGSDQGPTSYEIASRVLPLVDQLTTALATAQSYERAAVKHLHEARDESLMNYERAEKAEAELATMRAALERIVGMCAVPYQCTCGRPNGIGAVVSCANQALGKTEAP